MNEVNFDQSDVDQNRTIVMLTCIIEIIVPFIFFLPLVACKESEYGKFYANQCFLLFICDVVAGVLTRIPIISYLGWVIGVVMLVVGIINAINAYNGVRKGIPLIGTIEIFK